MEGITISGGKIKCSLYGDVTGIDCQCLQDTPCKGCFIFDSMTELEEDIKDPKELN